MIAGNDLMDFGLCDFMYVAGAGLIVHERNSVLYRSHILGREVLPHGVKGNKYAQVYGVVVTMSNSFQRADYFEADSI